MLSNETSEKVLKVLIYQASCSLTPHICYLILKKNCSRKFQIRFHFLETNKYKFESAQKHYVTVKNFGSKELENIILTCHPKVAFKDVDYAIILPSMLFNGELEHSKGSDGNLFINIGHALEEYAAKWINVIIFGPKSVNLLCSICSHFCPSINPSQITGVSYHHELRAKRILGDEIKGNPKRIQNVFVWGTDQVDIINACYEDAPNPETHVEENINAVQTIEFNDFKNYGHQSNLFSEESQQDSKSRHFSKNYKPKSPTSAGMVENLTIESDHYIDLELGQWKETCGIIQGFHCQDIVPVENPFECYTYDLWDIKSPDVTYKTKYFDKSETRDSQMKKNKTGESGMKPNLSKTEICPEPMKECNKLSKLIQDDAWIKSELIDRVKNLGSITDTKDLSTIAHSVLRHFQHLLYGSTHPISMIVNCDRSYNVSRGIYFSFPVRVIDGKVVIVRDMCMDSMTQRYIDTKSSVLKVFVDKLPFQLSKLENKNMLKEKLKSLIVETEHDEESSMAEMEHSIHSYASGPISKIN
ncbi:hypothetical protein WDU94_008405 [Cyamophila willieti]